MSEENKTESNVSNVSNVISFEDFIKVDLRAGTILEAERVPKSDKLLRLQLDFGELGKRQIVAGIGKTYEPDYLVGLQVVAVVNLAPRKLMGLESHGMILAAGTTEGHVRVLRTGSEVLNGTRLG